MLTTQSIHLIIILKQVKRETINLRKHKEEKIMGWYIFLGIIALIVNVAFSMKFAEIAEDKGYNGTPYGLLCFFFGVVGYCMVAALPDLTLYNRIYEDRNDRKAILFSADRSEVKAVSVVKSSMIGNKWVCGKCKTENSANYGQCKKCGTYRG